MITTSYTRREQPPAGLVEVAQETQTWTYCGRHLVKTSDERCDHSFALVASDWWRWWKCFFCKRVLSRRWYFWLGPGAGEILGPERQLPERCS